MAFKTRIGSKSSSPGDANERSQLQMWSESFIDLAWDAVMLWDGKRGKGTAGPTGSGGREERRGAADL